MTTTLIFDTLQYANRAQQAGFDKIQAEFQAQEIASLCNHAWSKVNKLENLIGQCATKKDLEKYATKEDLLGLRTETKMDIENLKKDMTIRFGYMLISAVLVLPALLKLIQLI